MGKLVKNLAGFSRLQKGFVQQSTQLLLSLSPHSELERRWAQAGRRLPDTQC